MSLDSIVTLNILRSAPAVSRQGFGTVLILGPNASGWGGDRIRTYTSPDSLLTDGFSSSSAEYKAAASLYSQKVKPKKFKVGLRGTSTAQVDTITPTAINLTVYTVTIDGVAYTMTSDSSATLAEIVTALSTSINADSACKAAATGSTTLVLTAKTAGVPFTAVVGANLALVHSTPDAGITADLVAIKAIDNDWYGLVATTRDNTEILTAAAWIETQRKVYGVSTSDAAVIAAGTTDIASKLKAKNYFRTFYSYSLDQALFPEAADFGNVLPLDVGAWTLNFKSRRGIDADPLTDSQETIAQGKNANTYTTEGGADIVQFGMVASGEFLDIVVGIDWIYANLQADVFQAFRDNDKIPFDDNGGAIIESIIKNRLQLAVRAQILTADPAFTVNVPKAADVDPADRLARRFSGITFEAFLAGAIHAVSITGSVVVPT